MQKHAEGQDDRESNHSWSAHRQAAAFGQRPQVSVNPTSRTSLGLGEMLHSGLRLTQMRDTSYREIQPQPLWRHLETQVSEVLAALDPMQRHPGKAKPPFSVPCWQSDFLRKEGCSLKSFIYLFGCTGFSVASRGIFDLHCNMQVLLIVAFGF